MTVAWFKCIASCSEHLVSIMLVVVPVNGTPAKRLTTRICVLQAVGALNIAKMNKLQHLNALAQLTQIQGDLVVWQNQELTTLEGLGPVNQLFGKLWVDANAKIPNLRGLEVGYALAQAVPCRDGAWTH